MTKKKIVTLALVVAIVVLAIASASLAYLTALYYDKDVRIAAEWAKGSDGY